MLDANQIGQMLLKERQKKNLTQQEVATLIGVSPKTISKRECGEGLPSLDYLIPLAKLYNISIEEILNGKRNENPCVKEKSINRDFAFLIGSLILGIINILILFCLYIFTPVFAFSGIISLIISIPVIIFHIVGTRDDKSINKNLKICNFALITTQILMSISVLLPVFTLIDNAIDHSNYLNTTLISFIMMGIITGFATFKYSSYFKTQDSFVEFFKHNKSSIVNHIIMMMAINSIFITLYYRFSAVEINIDFINNVHYGIDNEIFITDLIFNSSVVLVSIIGIFLKKYSLLINSFSFVLGITNLVLELSLFENLFGANIILVLIVLIFLIINIYFTVNSKKQKLDKQN